MEIIKKQIDAVAADLGVDAAKTEMLSSSGIVSIVARSTRRYRSPLLVGPVMISKSGAQLVRDEAVETLVKGILPLTAVATSNVSEAERLALSAVCSYQRSTSLSSKRCPYLGGLPFPAIGQEHALGT